MKDERGFRGVWIPAEIFDNKNLSIAEKFIYAYLASFSKVCFETNETIAEKVGVSLPTVTRALAKLQEIQYVFVEFINGNSAKRRIYTVYDNPKKYAYLVRKGLLQLGSQDPKLGSFPHPNQFDYPNQNDEVANQNDYPQNRGEANQNDYHRIKEQNKNKLEPEQNHHSTSAGLAGKGPAGRLNLKRKDFVSEDDYEKEFYRRNTIAIGAI